MATETGYHCPIDLKSRDSYAVVLSLAFDAEGYERGERINGFVQCPKCHRWWPCIEEPDMWNQRWDGKWIASGWWGASVCEDCDLLFVEQPDGTPETYRLNSSLEKGQTA